MHFRPFPILTLIAVPVLVALIWLGVWQAQRSGWKADVIRDFEIAAEAPPADPQLVCGTGLKEGQVVSPPQVQGEALRMFGHDADGRAGWRLMKTAPLCGADVLVEAGFEELELGGPGGKLPPRAEAPVVRFVVGPWPEKSIMAPANAPETNEWHWFDAPAMATSLGVAKLDATRVIVPLAGLPDFLSRTPPETHIGYAVTWFGIAIAFAVIYGVFHARAGRLRFGKARE